MGCDGLVFVLLVSFQVNHPHSFTATVRNTPSSLPPPPQLRPLVPLQVNHPHSFTATVCSDSQQQLPVPPPPKKKTQAAGPSHTSDNFSVRAYPSSREVVATMTIEDGASLELLIKLPASTPLRAAEVECRWVVLARAAPGTHSAHQAAG